MSPRPRLRRRVRFMPEIDLFRPSGITSAQQIILTIDEAEAIRLKDLEELEQKQAAKKMKISQPTFNRLLISARKKIADAIINSKAIKIKGGDFQMVQPRGRGLRRGIGQGQGRGLRRGATQGPGPRGICVCPVCSHKVKKEIAVPCTQTICPKCKSRMIREA